MYGLLQWSMGGDSVGVRRVVSQPGLHTELVRRACDRTTPTLERHVIQAITYEQADLVLHETIHHQTQYEMPIYYPLYNDVSSTLW